MSLFYSSLDKKMKSQRKENDYFQEASDKQVQAQKNLILTKKIRAMNEDIIARIVQRVDENKEKAKEVVENRFDFKNITNESIVPNLPFDDNIITTESFAEAVDNPILVSAALEKVAVAMRVKSKFTNPQNKKFDGKRFLAVLNANGIKQGSINNFLHSTGFLKDIASPAQSPATSPSVSPKGSPKAKGKGKQAKRT
jgi:hypothetical protein